MGKFQLLAWGANSHGQLGFGYESEQSVLPREIDLTGTNIKPDKIIKIVGGAGHTLILDNAGRVYSCGWNKKGQTGIPQPEIILNLQTIDAFKHTRIKDIECGWDSSIALTENGQVYTWGSNCFGQLGRTIHQFQEYTSVPDQVLIDSRVKRIAMGLRHALVLTEEGRILVAGAGNKSQLGIIDANDYPVRQSGAFVPGIPEIDEIACGQYFNIAITKCGEIYSWGNNKFGQLGFDCNKIKTQIVPIQLNEKIEMIKTLNCGWTHVGVLKTDGRIFSWGRNTYGQLGCQEKFNKTPWIPKLVENAEKIQQLSIGSEHNIALDDEGHILAWGWNEHGNCGIGHTDNLCIPEKILNSKKFKGILIGSGAGSSFAVVEKLIMEE